MSKAKDHPINLEEVIQGLMLASIENQRVSMHSVDNCVCKEEELEIINKEWEKLEKAVKLLGKKYGRVN